MGLETVLDLLEYYPRDYEDVSELTPISLFRPNETNSCRGFLSPIQTVRTKYGKQLQKAVLTDADGAQIDCVWFHQNHLSRQYTKETEVIVSGKVKSGGVGMSFVSPMIEPIEKQQLHTARIIPVYPETEGVSSKWLREKIAQLLPFATQIEDFLPPELVAEKQFLPRAEAITQIHFPTDSDNLDRARERLAFEEAFLLQTQALTAKYSNKSLYKSVQIPMDVAFIKSFMESLPFQLTNAQKIALYEILNDMEKDEPMLRLLEGDVGCGKTVVAAIAALVTHKNGLQTAVMAPTEILAKQHYKKFLELFDSFTGTVPRIELLIGSLSTKEKEQAHRMIAAGEVDLVIGTHALIQEAVQFDSLGLAIIDEQHRFGVEQRAKLVQHGSPHVLMMTATPIPRTLALTMYGDQDLSVIDEMPPGRKTIITRVVPTRDTEKAILFIKDLINKGRQVFVICPLINESEKLELKSVTEEYERLRSDIFPEYRITYLHGKMKTEEKDAIMEDFRQKKYDILVATSVIEVGIDIPNAAVMIIESSERFGLAQLHQFRGRVGRGGDQAYCFLFVTDPKEGVPRRLKAMEQFTDGFKLAEIDLEIRGPGQIYGLRQSGLPDMKLVSIMDGRLIATARRFAEKVLLDDLNLKKFPLLKKKIQKLGGRFVKA
jgi:ATP-dependent DNA helicase RecG